MEYENMKSHADLLVEASEKFLKIVAQTTSAQAADIRKAIADAGVLGLVGEPPNEAFDVNSKAADVIFGLMDKFGYRGKVFISVKVTAAGQVDLIVESQDPKLSAAVKQAFAVSVAAAAKKAGLPADEVLLKNLVMAQNA